MILAQLMNISKLVREQLELYAPGEKDQNFIISDDNRLDGVKAYGYDFIGNMKIVDAYTNDDNSKMGFVFCGDYLGIKHLDGMHIYVALNDGVLKAYGVGSGLCDDSVEPSIIYTCSLFSDELQEEILKKLMHENYIDSILDF